MVSLHVVEQIVPAAGRKRRTIDVRARTVLEAITQQRDVDLSRDPIVLLGASRLEPGEWEREIPDGLDVTIAPKVGDPISFFLAVLAVNAVAAYASHALAKKAVASALGNRQDQGDNGSPTYAWNNALSTTYGPGFAIAIVLGKHRVGGHAVDTRVEPSFVPGLGDILRVRQVLCEGPIHSIGGLSPPYGEADKLGSLDGSLSGFFPIPEGVKLNDVLLDSRGTEIAIRLGQPHQSRLPHWTTAATTLGVGAVLEDEGQTFTFAVSEPNVDRFVVAVNFSGGLYALVGGQRQPYPVRLRWEVRRVGGPWFVAPVHDVNVMRAGAFTSYYAINAILGTGAHEVRVTRMTPKGDPSTVVSAATWITIRHELSLSLTLAGRACMELSVVASDRQVDAQPNISVPVEGQLVRGWDPATGWTDYAWSVLPWVHPIGRNPAWQLAWLLEDDETGLGPWIKRMLGGTGAEELDLPAFRNWADFCDQDDPDDPGHAMFQCDLVLDRQAKPMDQVMAILRAGRAMPVWLGGKLSIVYEYLDAHGRGTNSVPARQPEQVITSSQCSSVEIRWLDPSTIPAQLRLQYVDEARDWQPDEVAVLDPDRTITGPGEAAPRITEEVLDFRGMTRRHAVRREGWFLLQMHKFAIAECVLKAGLQQISVTAGDLFWFVSEMWYPKEDEPTFSMHTLTDSPWGGAGVSSIVLDRDLEVRGAARVGTGIFVMNQRGVAQLCTVDMAGPTTIAAGDPVPLWDPAAGGGVGAPAAVKCDVGAVVATGTYGNFRRRMRVIRGSADPRYGVTLQAILWDPAMFAAPPPEALSDWGAATITSQEFPAPFLPDPPPAPAPPDTVSVGAGVSAGVDRLRWEPPPEQRGDVARVYLRRRGETVYQFAGESSNGELARDDLLSPGLDYETVVLLPNARGAYASPYEVDPVAVRVGDASGPPAGPVDALAATAQGGRLAATWAAVSDAAAYEVRRGATWDGRRVAVVPEPRLALELPEVGEHRLIVRARTLRGTLGPPSAVTVTVTPPAGVIDDVDDLPATGMHDGTTWNATDGVVELEDGVPAGTYTTPELDLGSPLDVLWTALVDWQVLTGDLVGELDVPIGELGTVGCPLQPSRQRPGVVAGVGTIAQLGSVTIAEASLARGDVVGHRGDVLVEARWHDGSDWGAWEPYRPQRRLAERMQARLTLARAGVRPRVLVDRLLLSASP